MTLLDRYLFRLFSKNLLLVLASLLTIYLLVHFFERIDDFMRANESLSLAAKYFLLKIPQMVEELIPITILLSGIISLGLINHQGELDLLKAAGIRTIRIVTPLLFSAIIFILVTLLLAEWIVPPTTATTNKILFEQVRKEKPRGIVRNDRYYYNDEQGIYSFKRQASAPNHFKNFSYARWDNKYNLQLLLSASKAIWNNGTWTFTMCQLKQPNSSGSYNVEYFKEKEIQLKATPDDFFTPSYKIEEMSLSGLYSLGERGEGPQNIEANLKFLERVSLILLGLPLLMLGLPIIMSAHQKWRKDISIAIPISCGLAFAAWGWWGAMQSFAKGGIVHPLMSAWLVHLLVGSLGFILLLRQDT